MSHNISIKGARVNNLKNIDVEIPRNKFVVITGLSGSGKSSLAFDTIYAEGQRRYVESLSSYARQFLEVKEKPDVDRIDGLSPAIAIDQNAKHTIEVVVDRALLDGDREVKKQMLESVKIAADLGDGLVIVYRSDI